MRRSRGSPALVWAAAGALAFAIAASVLGDGAKRPAAGSETVIGVVPQRPLEPGEGTLVREAGIQSVRFWLPWAAVEVNRDEYDWSSVDPVVEEVASGGMTPFPFLFGSPGWAAARDGFECEESECIPFGPASAETRNAFAEFAEAAARRYGREGTFWDSNPDVPYRPIRAWQIWNEPNLDDFWRPDADASEYGEALKLVTGRIRDVDAGAEIVLAGLSGHESTDTREGTARFLRNLYAVPGIEVAFDGVAVHPYSSESSGVFNLIQAAHDAASAHDSEFGLWVTEIGWASSGDERRWSLVKDLDGQASRLSEVFGGLLARGQEWDLRGVYWFAWRDTEPAEAVCGWCPGAGLVDVEGRPKPAYDELRLLAEGR